MTAAAGAGTIGLPVQSVVLRRRLTEGKRIRHPGRYAKGPRRYVKSPRRYIEKGGLKNVG
ncbi:Hypothetical protein DEACI_3800 [Acididesulfobacillus acetoxydans]|uniref:Uncharacterized protein n=1 Tax=Acididesulfobacillus acetoxydans TaxID=1561005 RepID=A0A8S0Y0B0_9FIRM|nr:Hypothetical protein DEACI_3800 [Acididesulfobacillus acetoxydans]CEJ05859.1 Hypothetical protein DEACI_0279 [Acididesulfobacillus acetoxydans]